MHLIATTFIDLRGGTSYGYRFFDDYSTTYNNLSESVIEDDLQLLEHVISECPDDDYGLLEYARETGLFINDMWYDPEEIANLFKAKSASE